LTPAFRYTLIWLAGSVIIMVATLNMLSGSYADGVYLPSNADAFYHARRILDAVASGGHVVQFDPTIHVPEGSWLTWPWGYDEIFARITALFGPYASDAAASRVLMRIPVFLAPVAVLVVVLLARLLRLGWVLTSIFTVTFATLPFVWAHFAVGNVDHHDAEMIWSGLTLCAGLWLIQRPNDIKPAIALGVVLGTAVAIQNGLFILQLAIAAAFSWLWVRRALVPGSRVMIALSITLLLVTVVACVPSELWRKGWFQFYTLSWFHTYIAAAVSVWLVLLSRLVPGRRSFLGLTVLAAVLAIPLLGSLQLGTSFVTGELASIQDVAEARSPYALYSLYGPSQSTWYLSWLMWLAAPAMLLNIYWALKSPEPGQQFFAVFAAIFIGLFQFQYRFDVFGIIPLLATPLIAVKIWSDSKPRHAWPLFALTALCYAVAMSPTFTRWKVRWELGGDPVYSVVRSAMDRLHGDCATHPGIVLAPVNDGHWIRFHTGCSVIGNVFLLTPQHVEKKLQVERMMSMSPQQLRQQALPVQYVLVHYEVEMFPPLSAGGPERPDLDVLRKSQGELVRTLLDPAAAVPEGYEQVWETRTQAGKIYGRMFRLHRPDVPETR
jgi:hypothetical protein